MVAMFLRSMTASRSAGGTIYVFTSLSETPLTALTDQERCVWMSISGKRARSTLCSGTWSMLRGWKSARSRGLRGSWAAAGAAERAPAANVRNRARRDCGRMMNRIAESGRHPSVLAQIPLRHEDSPGPVVGFHVAKVGSQRLLQQFGHIAAV